MIRYQYFKRIPSERVNIAIGTKQKLESNRIDRIHTTSIYSIQSIDVKSFTSPISSCADKKVVFLLFIERCCVAQHQTPNTMHIHRLHGYGEWYRFRFLQEKEHSEKRWICSLLIRHQYKANGKLIQLASYMKNGVSIRVMEHALQQHHHHHQQQ